MSLLKRTLFQCREVTIDEEGAGCSQKGCKASPTDILRRSLDVATPGPIFGQLRAQATSPFYTHPTSASPSSHSSTSNEKSGNTPLPARDDAQQVFDSSPRASSDTRSISHSPPCSFAACGAVVEYLPFMDFGIRTGAADSDVEVTSPIRVDAHPVKQLAVPTPSRPTTRSRYNHNFDEEGGGGMFGKHDQEVP